MAINKVQFGNQTLIDTSGDTASSSDVRAGVTFHSASGSQLTGSAVNTPGIIKMYAGNTAPDGWLICDGSAVSRSTYSLLYAVIGTTYGAGDGSTTFNIPDLQGRFALGAGEPNNNTAHAWGDNLTYDGTNKYNESIGNRGGESKHLLTENQIPSHVGHLANNSGISYIGTAGAYMATNNNIYYYGSSGRGWSITGNEASPAGVSRGGSLTHNNMPPYTTINYIISTGEPSEWSEDSSDTIVKGVLVDGQSVVDSSSGVAEIQTYKGYGAKVDISEYTRANIYTVPSDGIVQIMCGWETGCYCIAGVFNPGSDPNTTSAVEIECAAGTSSNMSGNLQAVLPVFKNQLVFIQKTNHQLNKGWFIPYIKS